LVADERVAALAILHAENLSRAHAIEELAGMAPGEAQSSHVGDVKEAAARSHPSVLLDDRGVEQRHLPAGVLDELGAVLDVPLVERRLEKSRVGRVDGW